MKVAQPSRSGHGRGVTFIPAMKIRPYLRTVLELTLLVALVFSGY
jgi:hypothetical protein